MTLSYFYELTLHLVNGYTYIIYLGFLILCHRTVANYMVWRIVMNRIRNLPQRFLDLQTQYNKVSVVNKYTVSSEKFVCTGQQQKENSCTV